jgi:hypothetical protein
MTTLCEKIAGTLNASDFARFEREFADPRVRELILESDDIQEALHRLTDRGLTTPEQLQKAAEAKLAEPKFDVVQIVPKGYGYSVKYSQAPAGVDPQQVDMTQQQAQQALPQEALQQADQQGVATLTGVEAEPDPLQEQPGPVSGFGLYKVFEAGTGKEFVGYCIPSLFDPATGQGTPQILFTNGSQYSLQPDMQGVLVGMNFNLPATQNVRGLGIFYKTDGKALFATVPFTIISEVSVEGKKYLSAQNMQGQELQLSIVPGMKKPMALSPQEVIIPDDFQFLSLDNPVQLEGQAAQPVQPGMAATDPAAASQAAAAAQAPSEPAPAQAPAPDPAAAGGAPPAADPAATGGEAAKPKAKPKEPQKQIQIKLASSRDENVMERAQARAYPTMMELRAWDGGCDLRGPVFEKVGSGSHDWVDGLFFMAAAGVPQNLGVALLEKAAQMRAPLRLYGLAPLSGPDELKKQAAQRAVADLSNVVIPERHCLLREMAAICHDKEAAGMVGTSAVDSVLALNFINPENLESFIEFLPQLEDASTKLASLVLATQLGMKNVPKTAAVRAMFAMEDVINGLKASRSFPI